MTNLSKYFKYLSILNKSIPDTELFYSHFYQVRQINTEDRNGNIDLINAKYRISPSEFLVGYGYFVDVANLSQNAGNPAARCRYERCRNSRCPEERYLISKFYRR